LELKGLGEPLVAWQVAWSADADAGASGLAARLAEIAGRGACVGRAGELGRLESAWKQAVAGERRIALVAGEPGIGKTRLAAAMAADVADRGAVLHGWCDEDLGIAYEAWVHALGAFLRGCDDDDFADIAPLAPSLL